MLANNSQFLSLYDLKFLICFKLLNTYENTFSYYFLIESQPNFVSINNHQSLLIFNHPSIFVIKHHYKRYLKS